MSEQRRARILIAERQTAVRSAVRGFLQGTEHLQVIGEAGNTGELLVRAQATCPDLVLLDWELAGESTVELIPALREPGCHVRVIVLGMRSESAWIALEAGADAFVYKGSSPRQFLEAIHGVLAEEEEPEQDEMER